MSTFKDFNNVSQACSKIVTNKYSTSFSWAIKLLHKSLHEPIYNIYGFVRFADEIVDTFHTYDRAYLLSEFVQDTKQAIEQKISLNPVLNSFQLTVNQFNIPYHLIDAFFNSMWLDVNKQQYNEELYKQYIYGSAEVVGLMCLQVFCNGDTPKYNALKKGAMHLGAAFQKINFLRDVKFDNEDLNRTYFPNVNFSSFNNQQKQIIEADIEQDFSIALQYIKQLPLSSRFGVYVAYQYYYALFIKIKRLDVLAIANQRIRINNLAKLLIVVKSYCQNKFVLSV